MSNTERPSYLDALADRVLVFDGAMGTNIQLRHPTPEDFGGKSAGLAHSGKACGPVKLDDPVLGLDAVVGRDGNVLSHVA